MEDDALRPRRQPETGPAPEASARTSERGRPAAPYRPADPWSSWNRDRTRPAAPASQPATAPGAAAEPGSATYIQDGYRDATAALAVMRAALAATGTGTERPYAAAELASGNFQAAHRAWQDGARDDSTAALYNAAALPHAQRAAAAGTRLSSPTYQPSSQRDEEAAPQRVHAPHRTMTPTHGPHRSR